MNDNALRTKAEFEKVAAEFKEKTGFDVEYHPAVKNHAILIIITDKEKYAYSVECYKGAIERLKKYRTPTRRIKNL